MAFRRSYDERRKLFRVKAPLITSQAHLDMILATFPAEQRQMIFDDVQPLLRGELVYLAEREISYGPTQES